MKTLVRLYHGTSSVYGPAIRRDGIVAVDDGGGNRVVYLGTTREVALGWARMRVDNLKWRGLPGGRALVIAVDVSPKNVREHVGDTVRHLGDIPVSSFA